MKSFALHLQSATRYERIADVASFVGADASGSFGLLAGHERAVTVLEFGLAGFRRMEGPWEYLALPGALLYFVGGELFLSTRRYTRDVDAGRIGECLRDELSREERERTAVKEALRRLEESILRRMIELPDAEAELR